MNHDHSVSCCSLGLAVATLLAPIAASPQSRPIPYPVVPPADFRQAIDAGTRTSTGEPGPAYWQQWTDYQLQARLLPDSKRIEGSARIVHHNHAPSPLPVVALHLHQNVHAAGAVRNRPAEVTGGVELARVVAGGATLREISLQQSPGAGYEVDGTTLYVRLPGPVFPGDSLILEIDWSFTVPQTGMGRMGWSRDDLFFVAYWYPQMAVMDDVGGWQVDPYLGNAEFFAGYGSYELTVEAPAGWVIMGSGELTNREDVLPPHILQRLASAETSDRPVHVLTAADVRSNQTTLPGTGGTLTWQFAADTLRDVAFSATRASLWDAARTPVGDRDHDGNPDYARIDAFYRESAPRWRHTARFAQHAIDFLSRYTGLAYPWPHMSVVEGADIIGGGMEFPMMTLIGDYTQATDSALYYVTAHELAHMWVPMIVGVDERRRAWMDEGTTTFNENEARSEFYPGTRHHRADREQYAQLARAGLEGELMRWTDYHYNGAARSIASYSKPATILVALRALLGEEIFNRGYRQYLANWAYKHPKPWDFFNSMATAAERDLDWFWRTWYYETWPLDQAISKVMETDSGTKVWVDDLGLAPMPVRLTITMVDGQQIREEIPVDEWLRGARTVDVTIRTPSPVARVEIDAEGVFPDSDRRNNVWTAN